MVICHVTKQTYNCYNQRTECIGNVIMDTNFKDTVLVTGFGPFRMHTVNASWEAAKQLDKLWPDSELRNVQLIIKEIPVSYDYVSSYVPKLWKEFNPSIVIHVGVSHKAQCLTIEHNAHSTGYASLDINEKCPDNAKCIQKVLETNIDVNRICEIVNANSSKNGYEACVSHDAGRYLCEYIFYQSLNIHPKKTLFVHVPDFDVYSSEQSGKGLYDIIYHLLK